MKTCKGCQKSLPMDAFPTQMRAGRVKVLARCVPCNSAYNAERYRQTTLNAGGRPVYRRDPQQMQCDVVADAWRYPVTFGLVGARLAA